MSAPRFVQARKTTIYATVSAVDSSVVLRRLVGHDGENLEMSDFGDTGYITIDPGLTTEEIVSFTGISRATNGSVTLTGVTRGLVGVAPYGSGGTSHQHNAGAIVVSSNNPQMYDAIIDYIDGIALAGTTDASLTGKGVVEAATTAEIDADTETGSTGALLSIDPSRLALSKYGLRLPTANEKSKLSEIVNLDFFGGDGSDGELNVASGTTTLDLDTKEVWQFTSITIAPGATLTFSNGESGDKIPVLKCQGDFDNQGTITTVGKGVPGGAGSVGVNTNGGLGEDGGDGQQPAVIYADTTKPAAGIGATAGTAATSSSSAIVGSGAAATPKNAGYLTPHPMNGSSGGGGGGGLAWNGAGTPGTGGDGGAGSLSLVIEVVGNFSNSGSILTDGEDGGNGTNGTGNGSQSEGDGAGGGGGGGAAGSLIINYLGTYTNTGTLSSEGGAGGIGGMTVNKSTGGGTIYDGAGGSGGSGGASSYEDGAAGSTGTQGTGGSTDYKSGGDGGKGGDSIVYVAKVTA